ncbi:hypothetical protein [Sphingomonas crocodyli]|uniref:SRPBCC family protein n=1 Tax=Sphingomonas crocodyli TaxID=1979270 RepID=A0A437M6G6_9SPHN|nr:hypothetical protein [Sphingomonas crocodyli]RVT93094.1 hypothetical protein EOD43_04135 [Sphingomonas crocodyli]
MLIETRFLIDVDERQPWRAISTIEAMNSWNAFVRLKSLDARGEAISYQLTLNSVWGKRAELLGVVEIERNDQQVRLLCTLPGLRLSEVYAIKRLQGRLWLTHSLCVTGIFDRVFGWLVERRLQQIIHLQNHAFGDFLSRTRKPGGLRSVPGGKHFQ